ncbi:MAG TPA: phosphatidate cytidylyltransferase [Acidimicrobiales bacterium]|nr:phosphatidate cytidylyltransferase [Acidimicrobiales bacterium]
MKSDDDDGTLFEEPTGEIPVVSTTDSRVTITGAEIAADAADETMIIDPTTLLPHWTDAPTGQVPIVVAREAADSDDPWSAIPAPAWREGEADWVAHEDQFDTAILAGEQREDTARPWEFAEPEVVVAHDEFVTEAPRPEPDRIQRTRRSISSNPLAGRAVRQSNDRNFSRALATGVVLAAVVSLVFKLGALPVAVMVLIVLGLAGAEAYAGFRSAGAHPATVLGIVAILTLGVAVYNKGLIAVGAVSVLLMIFGFVWYLNAGKEVDVLDGLGATVFVYVWIGVIGSYALLFVAPRSFVDGHGLSYLFGAMVLTVANDSGAFIIGRQFGKRTLNKVLSPNKTLEGTAGGTVVTLIAGALLLPLMSVWGRKAGLEAAVAISIVVPLGDLFESMVKRTIGVKDLGRLLPGHGGLLDRIDGLLFALPTMYYLCHVLKLG